MEEKLKLKLLLLIIPIFGISLGITEIINFKSAYETILKNKINELTILRDLKVREIGNFFHQVESDLRLAQDYYNIKETLPILAQFIHDRTSSEYLHAGKILDDTQIKTLVKKYLMADFQLINPEGKIVYAFNKSHGEKFFDKELPGLEHRAFEEGQIDIYFSEVFKDDTTDSYLMLVSGPLYDSQGQLMGVIIFDVNMQPVYDLISDRLGLGETGETIVGRKEGDHVLFLHPLKYDSRAAFQKKIYYTEKKGLPMREASQGRGGAGITVDYRGEPVIAAWQPLYVGNHQWGLVTKIDKREAFLSIQYLQKSFILIFVVTLILAIGIILLNAVSITQPLEKLMQAVSLISKQRLDVRVEGVDTKDELGDLARAFNQMAEDLQKTTVSRDELVKAQEQTQKAFKELQESQTAAMNIMEDLKEETEVRKKNEQELRNALHELERFNEAVVGREERMIELKEQINKLSKDLDRKPPYDLSLLK